MTSPAQQQQTAISQLQQSPLYQSLFNTGRDTILGAASATGGLRGGNVNNSLARFGSDTLAQTIQQQIANLGGIQGQGQQAGLGLAGIGANNANSITGLNNSIANSRSGAILGDQAVTNQNNLANNNLFSQIGGGVTSLIGGSSGGGILSSLFGGGGGFTPSFSGASSKPYNLGSLDTSSLTQALPF